MCTVLTMHATFIVHCRINMNPLNRTQPTDVQLCCNQLINHNSWIGVRGGAKIFLPGVFIFLDFFLNINVISKKNDTYSIFLIWYVFNCLLGSKHRIKTNKFYLHLFWARFFKNMVVCYFIQYSSILNVFQLFRWFHYN